MNAGSSADETRQVARANRTHHDSATLELPNVADDVAETD
jgi:hypothetical protein